MTEMLEILPIEKLTPSKDNPRRKVGDVKELAASITAVGILEPLVVSPDGDGGHVVVAGHRRLAAAKKAGLAEVPCVVRELDDAQRAEAGLIENLQRVDLAPLEEAAGFRRLVDDHGYSQRQLAERIGRSQAHVSKRLALLELPKEAQRQLDNGRITIEEAVALTKLAGMPKRLRKVLDRPSWTPLQHAVDEQLAEHRRAEARGKVVERLKKKGVKVVATPGYSYSDVIPKGPARVGSGPLRHVDAKAHEKEECHAVAVDIRDASILPVCTKPAAHKRPNQRVKDASSSTPQESPQQQKVREHREALAAEAPARTAVVQRILGRKIKPVEALAYIAPAVLGDELDVYETGEVACAWLGLDETKGWDVLRTYAAESPEHTARAAFAVALAAGEWLLRDEWRRAQEPEIIRYLTFLKEHGYELSPAEKRELAGKAPR